MILPHVCPTLEIAQEGGSQLLGLVVLRSREWRDERDSNPQLLA